MDSTTYGLARRALPTAKQARIVLIVASCAAGLLAVSWGAARLHAAPADLPITIAKTDSALHLTATQLSSLTINTVSTQGFRTEQVADGRIALNSDTATQIFSPYS